MATTWRTVRQLAQEANIEIDDALLSLWGNDFNEIKTPDDKIWPRNLKRARRAIGYVPRQDPKTALAYWMKLLNLNDSEFKALLQKLEVPLKGKTKLQRKDILRLKAEVRNRGINRSIGTVSIQSVTEEVSVRDEVSKIPVFTWRTPGHERELRWLSADEVLLIHYALVNDFSLTADPIYPPGPRSKQLLASAVFRPQTANGDNLKYPTVETSAAALLHSIVLDHPFHNGNKRTALVSVLVFLDENNFLPYFDQDEVFKLLLQVAQHRIVDSPQSDLADREVLAIAEWFVGKCRYVEKGERPLSFLKLRQILVSHECDVSPVIAGKISITRDVVEPIGWGILKTNKKRRLQTQMSYAGDGREVHMSTIKKIRKELYLDELHAIDSHVFYSKEPPVLMSEFIARYRKTLDRLAKF
jgi:prophage maintenance system killer protein